MVTPSPWFFHSVPLLKSRFPVKYRIIFKLCTIDYETLSSLKLPFILSILSLVPESISRVKTHAGTCAYLVAVPTLWNILSEYVKSSSSIISFRHHLETHLFKLVCPSYICWWILHSTLTRRMHTSCCRCPTELDSFRGYWRYRSLLLFYYHLL